MTIFHSDQAAGLLGSRQDLSHVSETEGKVRISRFTYTAVGTETFGDTILLAPLPPGRIMVLGELCKVSSNPVFTNYDLGHDEFRRSDGSIEPRSLARFGSPNGATSKFEFDGDDAAENTVLDAMKTLWIIASITGADPSAGGTIQGHVAYTIS